MRPLLSIVSITLSGLVGACGSAPSLAPSVPQPSSVAAPASQDGPSSTTDWAALARPLQLPHLAADQTCPQSSGGQVSPAFGPAFGDGPVYPVFGSNASLIEPSAVDGGYRAKVLWVSASSYQGPVLIRGAQVDGSGALGFAEGDSGNTTELRLLDATATSDGEEAGWREWPSYTNLAESGCYAYQVDASFGTTVIVFSARVGG
jgi:hypothetical protein